MFVEYGHVDPPLQRDVRMTQAFSALLSTCRSCNASDILDTMGHNYWFPSLFLCLPFSFARRSPF
ncbi:hypothetical protein JI435_404330 [Parastagonospora nodorum SN15]|uniref:Uncharacterized protein n=1 Tax=Phaeosphaeria nodorum (strain SN15 / ATCC MYA-4574 / FGSC 10173) TaxID=321614 RepID=A0A7U2HWZ3_PHANO|nr:hypothetical protein JI435_404330 [Parastagonospora nodorum SN15]